MANMLENFGLDFFEEDENTLMGFIGYLAQEGKGITGYYGTPYLFKSMGNPEFWVKTERNEENKLEVTGVDSHCANMCVWEMIHSGIDITPKDSSKLSKTIMFNSATTHGGLIPIEIISADVLPSFMKDDKYEIQMVALPLDISYYADEEAYAEAQPAGENGEKWLVANGSLAALSFLYNHSPERYEKDKEYESDCYVQFAATVKELYHGTFEMNDVKNNMFIRCFADTQFGKLEFDHTLEMVPEELRDNIKVGSIISGTCILSGDVAIKEYDQGIVKDFEHNLKLLRYTLEEGDPERLESVLTPDAVYDTDTSGEKFVGPREIIDKIKYVQEHSESKYITNYATIAVSENGEFPVGTRCIVLSSGESDNYESIAFIKVNYDGLITDIKISTDSAYRFEVDKPEKISTPLDDCEFPDNVAIPIINRAKFMGLIDEDADEKSIIDNIEDYYSLEDNAQRMLSALEETPQPDVEKAFENIFGYLFAKAIEQTINEKEKDTKETNKLLASYSVDDAFEGKITSTLPSNKHHALKKAMKTGSEFYTDLKVFVQLKDKKEEEFVETFKQAAVIVQRIGQVYAENGFWKENMDNFIPKNAVEFCNRCKKQHRYSEGITCDVYKQQIPIDVLIGDVHCENFEQKTELYAKMQGIIRCPKVTHEVLYEFLRISRCKREMLPWEHCAMKFQKMGVSMKREFLAGKIYMCNYGDKTYYFGIDLDEPEVTDDMLENGSWLVYTWAD